MKDELEPSVLLVGLDELLDTRIAVLSRLDMNIARTILTDESYYQRKIDIFGSISFEDFKVAYDERSKVDLFNASMTKIPMMVNKFVKDTIYDNLATPYKNKPLIRINAFPYILTPEEEQNIIMAIIQMSDKLADVELVYMSNEELTPKYMKANVDICIMYRYIDWINTHSLNGNLKKTICPELPMMSPAISFSVKETNLSKNKCNVIEKECGVLVALRLIDVREFSLLLNPFKVHKA